MLEQPSRTQRHRARPRRRRRWLRVLVLLLAVAGAFVLGIALGRALEDGPQPGPTVTYVRTLEPITQRTAP